MTGPPTGRPPPSSEQQQPGATSVVNAHDRTTRGKQTISFLFRRGDMTGRWLLHTGRATSGGATGPDTTRPPRQPDARTATNLWGKDDGHQITAAPHHSTSDPPHPHHTQHPPPADTPPPSPQERQGPHPPCTRPPSITPPARRHGRAGDSPDPGRSLPAEQGASPRPIA